jgi:RNA exonuclease 4
MGIPEKMPDKGAKNLSPNIPKMMKGPISSNWKALSSKLKNKNKENTDDNIKSKEELWFDVSEKDLQRSRVEGLAASEGSNLAPIDLFPKLKTDEVTIGKYMAIDCEMVGVGPEGLTSALARVSLVNFHGQVIFDKYVRPVERIVNYRTEYSGIRPHHMKDAIGLREAQEEIFALIQDKVLIGHSLLNDFRVLFYNHPRKLTRDTSKYRPFRKIAKGKSPSLKRLAQEFLGLTIQEGEHDSVDDARVAMLLYRAHKDEWENYLFRQEGKTFQAKKRLKAQKRNGCELENE